MTNQKAAVKTRNATGNTILETKSSLLRPLARFPVSDKFPWRAYKHCVYWLLDETVNILSPSPSASLPVCLYSVIIFVLLPFPIHSFWLCILISSI